MHCLDSAIGNVTAALSQKNMWAKTLVVFSADNGGREDAQFGGNNWPRESSESCATFALLVSTRALRNSRSPPIFC